MRNSIHTALLLTSILAITSVSSAYGAAKKQAGNLYRYKNDHGVTEIGRAIPSHLVGKGYEILNNSGRVVEVIPPALTPEQIVERDKKAAEVLRIAAEAEQQKENDKELLKLYSHPNDAVRVLSRKLQDIEDFISLKKGNISVVTGQLELEEAKAANRERTGKKVSNQTLNKIQQQKTKIVEMEQEIAVKRIEKATVKIEFDKIIKRLETITNKQADNYPEKTVEQPEKVLEQPEK